MGDGGIVGSQAAADQLAHIVEVLVTCSRIRYIDLRGPDGVLATTPGAEGVLAAAPAPAEETATRELMSPQGAVLELVREWQRKND